MAFLRTLHSGFSNAIVLYSLALGLWALYSAWRRNGLSGSYWGALVLGEGLMIVQAVVGVLMWLQGSGPGQWVHILYGVLALIVWPGAYAFMYRRDVPQLDPRRQAVLFGLIGLFLAGVGLRAITTAVPK
jgi:hypothetical protein